jgi:hypothetical protein
MRKVLYRYTTHVSHYHPTLAPLPPQEAYLCIPTQRINNIQPLPRHGGVEAALEIA